MSYARGILTAFAVVIAFAISAAPVRAADPDRLTISTVDFVGDAHRILAQDAIMTPEDFKRFTFRYWAFGRLGMEDVVTGGSDLALVTSFPVVRNFLKEHNENTPPEDRLVVLGNLFLSQDTHFVIADRLSGIRYPIDLQEKTVGVTPNTLSDFVLDRFSQYFGLQPGSVGKAAVPINELLQALSDGAVDAGVAWHPTAQKILNADPERFIRLATGPYHMGTWVIVAKAGTLETKGELITEFLQKLIAAEEMYYNQPATSEQILADRLGLTTEELRPIVSEYTFQLSLNESLVYSMTSILRWMCQGQRELGCAASVRDIIAPELTRRVRPETVRLLGKN